MENSPSADPASPPDAKGSAVISADTSVDGVPLDVEEQQFLEELLRLTGREDRLTRHPLITPEQASHFRALLPELKEATRRGYKTKTKCDLLNRLILGLGIKPMSESMFATVLDTIDLGKVDDLHSKTERFRVLCMLEFGSFRYGYKILRTGRGRNGEPISDLWSKHFPTTKQIEESVGHKKADPPPIGLTRIPPGDLSVLGYLSGEATQKVNSLRDRLRLLLEKAISERTRDGAQLLALARREGTGDLANLLAQAGIPDSDRLLYNRLSAPSTSPYRELLDHAIESCTTLDENRIDRAKRDGRRNTLTYLAMHDVDVYVATSMRTPIHFANNHSFVQRLFHEGELAGWNLRYFDPTQSFVDDRILKGLTECLMIKRASVTVYNAQESDTFGKDAEAGVALAQGKPVIVYVARLFWDHPDLVGLYEMIDSAIRTERSEFLRALVGRNLISETDATAFSAPELSAIDVASRVLRANAHRVLSGMPTHQIEAELISHGYEPPKSEGGPQKLLEYATERVVNLERRALTFREIHPLSLQASPVDGVARGVIVTRTVGATAVVLRGLLVGGLEYIIADLDACWQLLEATTRSPVRVVAKDAVLTTAFWHEWQSLGS